jgi:Fe/S biogenesis protein NfuA
MITITELARDRIAAFMKAENRPNLALRFAVEGRGPGGFMYRLAFVDLAERTDDDQVVDAGPFQVLIDATSVDNLKGTTLDFVEGPNQSGFRIDNPNPLWRDPVATAVQKVFDEEINPAVATHGGWVALLDVRDDVAYVQLGGGCQGCGMVDVTLRQGIEVRLREVVPQLRGVVDTTDHAGGANPYYRPAKGGGASPYS